MRDLAVKDLVEFRIQSKESFTNVKITDKKKFGQTRPFIHRSDQDSDANLSPMLLAN